VESPKVKVIKAHIQISTIVLIFLNLVRIHGHLCDGLVIAFIEIRAVLEKLFPDGVVDRTDLRAVSKNGPCWVDAVAMMTGARINFKTLRIDNSIGDRFIIQHISRGDALEVYLKGGMTSGIQGLVRMCAYEPWIKGRK